MTVPSIKLNTGCEMPIVGLGTWKSKSGEVQRAVEVAIDSGYRHVDCALVYGNEKEVGSALKKKIDEGKVTREDMFITGKLWNVFHHPSKVRGSLQESLNNLQTSYLDLYLIHWPMAYVLQPDGNLFPKDSNGKFIYDDTDYVDTWKELEKAKEEGIVKNIGVSNFNAYQVNRIIKECKVVPAVNQVELHPYLNQEETVKFCQTNKVAMTAYSPLGSPDRPWVKPDEPVLLEDPKLVAIAERLKKTVAQILLRYQIQRNIIVIPKSVTPSRIQSNLQLFDFELSADDMATVAGFDRSFRGCALEWVSDHKYWPFKENYTE
uniref:alcohol dehydrogenase (NADP(+)) n=1 Tax=Ciona intestinalis TaxID=7719 RepID=A0A1W2WFK8_CIOIN|nr:aldose reductase-like [Ciona intestinalis]|eukprot:XP_009861665.1 aldose reductase-like [Ciona intestinalis]